MLDAGTAVRDLAEIITSEFLLFLEAERAVIGRDDLQSFIRKPRQSIS
jgi:hypothetical protein